jgi:hypothetical protein
VLRNVIKQKIPQMYYEARIAAVVFYYARAKNEEKKRHQACLIKLKEAQYMQVIHLFLTVFHMISSPEYYLLAQPFVKLLPTCTQLGYEYLICTISINSAAQNIVLFILSFYLIQNVDVICMICPVTNKFV